MGNARLEVANLTVDSVSTSTGATNCTKTEITPETGNSWGLSIVPLCNAI